MTRPVCETCGRYQASREDWAAMAPGEGEDLCWHREGVACDGRDAPQPIPRLRVERWIAWVVCENLRRESQGRPYVGAYRVLSAILSGQEPPE